MKKIIISLLTFILLSTSIFAWEDCPYGEVDEPYPGTCPRWEDTDNDRICDLSQVELKNRIVKEGILNTPINISEEDTDEKVHCGKHTEEEIKDREIIEDNNVVETEANNETVDLHNIITGKELKTKTVEEVAILYEIDANKYAEALSNHYNTIVKTNSSFQVLHDDYNLEPSTAKDIASSIKIGEYTENIEKNSNIKENNELEGKYIYHLLPITFVLIFLYIISYILTESKTIKLITHRRIWNVLLLISFLISGLLAILLIISINFGIKFSLPFNTLFWHVEAGIVMLDISIIHIYERRQFFINMVKKGM